MSEQTEFTVAHPFVRTTYDEPVFDCDGVTFVKVKCWKPGVEFEPRGLEDVQAVADGVGSQRLTVISRHKPGRYPERVFYVRQWIDPDGNAFGKKALRVTTAGAFKTLVSGYRYRYALREQA